MASKKAKAAPNGEGKPGEQLEITVPLKPDVVEHKRDKVVVLLGKYRAIKSEMDAESKKYRVKLKELDKEMKELQDQIDTGSKKITVVVREELQLATHSVLKRREDNGAVVDERPMTAAEHREHRQMTFDQAVEAGQAKENGNGNGAGKPKRGRKGKGRSAEAQA